MAEIKWNTQALADLEAIGDFIARDTPSYAQIFVDQVFDTVRRLESFPRSGRIVPEMGQEKLREIIFGSYRIVYLVSENDVSILTIFHSSKLLKLSNVLESD